VAAIFAMVLSFLFFLITLFVLAVFIKYRDTPVVKGSNRNLSYVLLTAIALCYVLPFLYIGIPTNLSCAVQPVYFGFVFTLCVAIMLTKTQRLLTVGCLRDRVDPDCTDTRRNVFPDMDPGGSAGLLVHRHCGDQLWC
jgi:hypothetical protein